MESPTAPVPHVTVGGIPIFDGDIRDATAMCLERIAARRGGRVATANLDFLAIARKDPVLKNDLGACDLVVADGKPVAVLARLAGGHRVRRVAGVDLVDALVANHNEPELRLALYGAAEPVSAAAAEAFSRHPRVRIVARLVPPFRPLTPFEEEAEQRQLSEADPHLVLVALGCPRQERLAARYFEAAPHALWIGVGGTFEFVAGVRMRAPAWSQWAGFEWAVRLIQEPRRLWRRYLVRDVPALGVITASMAVAAVRRRLAS